MYGRKPESGSAMEGEDGAVLFFKKENIDYPVASTQWVIGPRFVKDL